MMRESCSKSFCLWLPVSLLLCTSFLLIISAQSEEQGPYLGRGLKEDALSPSEGIPLENKSVVLAADRTARPNPLNHFRKYRQGWNIRDSDYWASVGFTAAPGFILSGLWVAFGLALLLLTCCFCCCFRKKLRGKHEGGTSLPLLLLLLLTAAAVSGCVLVYVGQAKFHVELNGTLDYVLRQSEMVVGSLHAVISALREIKFIDVLTFALPTSDQNTINELSTQLTNAAETLVSKTSNNTDQISDGLEKVRKSMIVVAAVMLLLVVLGLVFALMGASALVYMLLSIGWLLVAGTWILCGVYILLNNAMGDTCVAMDDWVNNPSATTTLDSLLPCVDVGTANKTLGQTRRITDETTNGINLIIGTVFKAASLQPLCNPVHPEESSSTCVNFTAAPQAWESHICTSGVDIFGRCIPQQVYKQMNSSVHLINGLYVYTSFLVDLIDCDFARNAFNSIRENHCNPLRKYSKWQYIGLALISGGASLSMLLWVAYVRRRRHRWHSSSKQNQPIYGSSVPMDPKAAV